MKLIGKCWKAQSVVTFIYCAGAVLAANSAHAIVGGSPSSKPWVVGVINIENGHVQSVCSGAAISPQLVVTAKHCAANAVIFDNRTATVARRHDVPGAGRDTSILVLTAPHPLTEYPVLSLSENPSLSPGMEGFIYGYGSGLSVYREQRQISFTVGASSNNSVNLQADGTVEAGDSGAPWLINGELVGVHHGESKDAPPGTVPPYQFDSIWYALDLIKEQEYLLRARALVASEL